MAYELEIEMTMLDRANMYGFVAFMKDGTTRIEGECDFIERESMVTNLRLLADKIERDGTEKVPRVADPEPGR